MRKILVINDLVKGGGVECLMRNFILHWYKKYTITVLTINNNSNFYDIYPKTIKHLYLIPKRIQKDDQASLFYKIINRIRYYIRLLCVRLPRYDIILAMKEGRVMKLASKFSGNIKLSWVHLDYINRSWTNNLADGKQEEINYMSKYDHIICVSEYIKDSILKEIGDPGNLTVKYNPIKVEEIIEKAKETPADIEVNKTALRFITIGRLDYQKGYDVLLKACKKLDEDGLSYELWIIGEGKDKEELRKQIADDNIMNVRLLGYKENPYQYLVMADWFISSSRYEGYSLVTQEAAILNIPIIATDCSGVRELLGENGEYGIITEMSVHSIYEAMKKVIMQPFLRDKYSKLIEERKKIISYYDRMNAIEELFNTAKS